jgi:hypothetical protein
MKCFSCLSGSSTRFSTSASENASHNPLETTGPSSRTPSFALSAASDPHALVHGDRTAASSTLSAGSLRQTSRLSYHATPSGNADLRTRSKPPSSPAQGLGASAASAASKSVSFAGTTDSDPQQPASPVPAPDSAPTFAGAKTGSAAAQPSCGIAVGGFELNLLRPDELGLGDGDSTAYFIRTATTTSASSPGSSSSTSAAA